MKQSQSSPTLSSHKAHGSAPPREVTKNEFKDRQSKLDSAGHLIESEYRGFFSLITVVLTFFFFTTQTKKLMGEGTLVGLPSAWDTFNRFELFPAWLFICGGSFIAVIIQKIILLRVLPAVMVSVLTTGGQVLYLVVVLWVGYSQQFPLVQGSFFLAEVLILGMKLHSYLMTNKEYDAEFIKSKKEKKEKSITSSTETEDDSKLVRYPQNVTFGNYLYFLLVPTLVYELNYPKTSKVRPAYLLEKLFSFIGMWAVLHVLVDSQIRPVLENTPDMTHFEAVVQLLVPFTAVYLMIFYMIFDVACNGFAEITRFADREFYSDWWNSTSWDQFARKWNKPVHEFLLRHVYLESIKSYKVSKNNATFITFFFSSIFHEFFMMYTLRIFRPWLFFFQMSQLPMIFISRHPLLKGGRGGNYFFWFGILLGVPLLSILYGREYMIMLKSVSN